MKEQQIIELILIEQIHIANPRTRSRGRWQMIVANIREVGLKKPISVVRRKEPYGDGKQFDLVCGQGRIEAFIALGETTIPAIVTEASREDQFLMSLVENIARRPPSNRDIIREVRSLRDRGYSVGDIAKKIGMERMYVTGIVHLVEHKEISLIDAVEGGRLPISVAAQIASGKDTEISEALSEGGESRRKPPQGHWTNAGPSLQTACSRAKVPYRESGTDKRAAPATHIRDAPIDRR